jgi:hypothetical protein
MSARGAHKTLRVGVADRNETIAKFFESDEIVAWRNYWVGDTVEPSDEKNV